jgi:ferric-dicitrate binding protein FerR (iron transport regulator)
MSDRLSRHVTPELSDARLQRQYAAISVGLQNPRARALPWLWVAPAAVMIALVYVLLRPPAHSDTVAPKEIASLETGSEGQVLTLADGSRLEAAPETKLVLGKISTSHVRLELDRGRVVCDVTKDPQRNFEVEAEGYAVRVVGTRFGVELVERDGRRELRVDVTRGAVEVVRDGESPRRVSAGETWSAVLGGAELTQTEAPAIKAPVAPSAVAEAPAPAKPSETAQQLFDRAQKARAAGRLAEAKSAFSALRTRYPKDPRASLAAFELARLELDEKGDAKQATKLLDDAVKNAPAGSSLKEDAEARRIEALDRAGDRAACRAARNEFLSRYEKSVHRTRVLRACSGP